MRQPESRLIAAGLAVVLMAMVALAVRTFGGYGGGAPPGRTIDPEAEQRRHREMQERAANEARADDESIHRMLHGDPMGTPLPGSTPGDDGSDGPIGLADPDQPIGGGLVDPVTGEWLVPGRDAYRTAAWVVEVSQGAWDWTGSEWRLPLTLAIHVPVDAGARRFRFELATDPALLYDPRGELLPGTRDRFPGLTATLSPTGAGGWVRISLPDAPRPRRVPVMAVSFAAADAAAAAAGLPLQIRNVRADLADGTYRTGPNLDRRLPPPPAPSSE